MLLGKLYHDLLPYFPPKVAHSLIYYKNHNSRMNWRNPATYDEKLTWLICNIDAKKYADYADKLKVREYVSKCGFGSMLTEIYGTWNSIDEIELDRLPNNFILKTNHAAGGEYYVICKEKTRVDWKTELKKIESALKREFWKDNCEYHYKYIKPKVYAEQLLDDGIEERMIDYKIHCFNGEPFCILVCSNRAGALKLDYYSLDWEYLDITPLEYRSMKVIERPKGLGKMILAAKKLGKKFPCVRVDFYDVYGKVYFSELTLTPGAACLYYINDEWQKTMGNMIKLPL